MKKNYKTKSMMRLLITLMLMATLLLGCSSTEAETETAKAKPEVEATVTEPAEVEEEAPVEETKPEETETTEAETETEATEEEPATTETEEAPVEESTDPQISEEPVELIDLANYGGEVSNYMDTLDPNEAEIVIFNQSEGYVINMQEGQYYQLKSTDMILFNCSELYGYGYDSDLGGSTVTTDNFTIYKMDYSKFQEKQEFFLKKQLDSGEVVKLTCYFDPPTE